MRTNSTGLAGVLFLVATFILILAFSAVSEGVQAAPVPTPPPADIACPDQDGTDSEKSCASPTLPPPVSIFDNQLDLYGIEFSPITPGGGLDLVEAAGSQWVRSAYVSWAAVEPQQGAREWDALAAVETQWLAAIEAGITPIVVIKNTPGWAQLYPGVACGPIHPDSLNAFGDFLYDLVARYSQPPYNLKLWEIWNEPDVSRLHVGPNSAFGCWGEQDEPYYGGRYYGEMLKVVAPRIKAADTEAQVLLGGLALICDPRLPSGDPPGWGEPSACPPALFLTGILEAGGGDFFDGVSFHAYDFYWGLNDFRNPNWGTAINHPGPVSIAKTRYLQQVLKKYRLRNKSLLNTETALLCGSTGQEPYCLTEEFETTKAYYVAHSYAAARTIKIDLNLWFTLRGWRRSGLVDASLNPLPAYQAYQTSEALLSGAIFRGHLQRYAGVAGYTYKGVPDPDLVPGSNKPRRIWILWSESGEGRTITLPSRPALAFDVYGNLLIPTRRLTVSMAPVYLIW